MQPAEMAARIRAGRAEIDALWMPARPAQRIARPGPQADWSVKDLLAHFIFWERAALDEARLVLRGQSIPPQREPDEVINARAFAAHADHPWAAIERAWAESLRDVLALVGSLSSDDPRNPALWACLADGTVEHYAQHLNDLILWAKGLDL